jgi:hypothetical protein
MYEEQIFEPNDNFNFENINLLTPTIINKTPFLKLKINNLPLMLQSPKCVLKQSINNNNKKNLSELIFSTEEDNQVFFKWIEILELCLKKIILKNKKEWFGEEFANTINNIDDISFKNTIKNFNLPVIIYPDLKVYDENENEIEIEKINGEQTNLLCILEIEGVKSNINNFQIQIKVRQIMTLEPILTKCLIKKKNTLGNNILTSTIQTTTTQNNSIELSSTTDTEIKKLDNNLLKFEIKNLDNNLDKNLNNNLLSLNNNLLSINLDELNNNLNNKLIELTDFNAINIDESNNDNDIKLKSREEIIKNKYKMAKELAKRARKLALLTHLEKIEIKNTYMLDNIESESDSDDDELFQ